MARISTDQVGLRDAADMFGVSIDTLRRRIRDNQLDEAQLVQGPFGATWVLPRAALDTIAERESWDLDDVSRVSSPPQPPSVGSAQTDGDGTEETTLIDLTDRADAGPPPPPPPPPSSASTPVKVLEPAVDAAVVAERVAQGLADNVQAELTAVREAITAAEVRAVAAEARNDALMTEKSRLEAQLKRAEADIEYWRSQHDRLDKDLDREQAHRTASDKAKAVAESETRDARQRVAELTVDLTDTQLRERVLIASEASLSAELDQASMAMGWWSRRRLAKLQARSSPRPASPVVGE